MHKVLSRRVLYLAVLLHDIAKGRGGDHSELGAEVAQKLWPAPRPHAEETETVAWLVRYHLLMSKTAFKRDIDDPQTIADFAAEVQSLERLRLLLVLTVADIRAVGPQDLERLEGAAAARSLSPRRGTALRRPRSPRAASRAPPPRTAALRAELADWNAEDIDTHLARGTASYWLSFDTATLARHARLVRTAEAREQELSPGDPHRSLARGHRGHDLHARPPRPVRPLAGAIAAAGGNIVDARIFTLTNGMALDTFWVQDAEGGPFERARPAGAPLRHRRADPRRPPAARSRPALPGATRAASTSSRWRRACSSTTTPRATHTVIEVNGRDRPGLLYRLTARLTELKLQISSAKISTFGQRAVDVFYVKDQYGLKIEAEARLKAIRAGLMQALEPESPAAAAASEEDSATAAQ